MVLLRITTHPLTFCRPLFRVVLALCVVVLPVVSRANDDDPALAPRKKDELKVEWRSLVGHSMTFLTVSHAFRWAKEYYTREATLNGPYFRGVGSAVGNLHGWADGDEFLCNYVGHPMEGAVAGYIFSHNDPKYREEEFGRNRGYWRGKTRAFVFSALYSAQFEIGPFSEATVGKIQAYWPQRGFVDWAVTPTVGLAWTLAEDSLDKYVAKPLEGKIRNRPVRAAIRSWLNPARSFANMMALKYPWHRDTRPGLREYDPEIHSAFSESDSVMTLPLDSSDPYGRKHAQFAFNVPFQVTRFGRLSCVGGGTTAQIPLGSSWDAVFDLSGCKLLGLPRNFSGDSLTYMMGTRWSPKTASRAAPHFRLMIGGHKIYEERLDPDLKTTLLAQGEEGTYYRNVYLDYTQNWQTNGLAVSIGGGVDVGINRAIGLRLASVEYLHSWLGRFNGYAFNNGIRLSTGLIVNVGSW